MKTLYLLIHSLSRKEVTIVRNTLQTFYSRPHLAGSKMTDLFELLLRRKKMPNPDFISLQFFQKPKDNTLDKLSSRLKNKILDILISEANNEKHAFDQLDLFTIKIRKKLAQFYQLYFSKGNDDPTAHYLLQEIIDLSRKYESYPALIEALRLSKYYQSLTKGIKEFRQADAQIIFYEYCSKCVYKAIDYYYKLILKNEFLGKSDEKKIQVFLYNAISELKKDLRKTKSSVLSYYLHQLQLAYYLNEDNYKAVHKTCIELLVLLDSKKAVYKKERMGIVYINLAQSQIYLGNFNQAVLNAQNAQKFISDKIINFLIFKEVEFHALFYNGMNKEALNAIEEIIKRSKNAIESFRFSKIQYFYSCVFFQNGNYKQALNLLNKNMELSQDKSGWEVSVRILKTMCMLELEQFEQATHQIENLRKHMERHSLKKSSKRSALILKILILLERKGFNYDEVDLSEKINHLAGDNKNYCWTYMSPELIPFHQWLSDKIK